MSTEGDANGTDCSTELETREADDDPYLERIEKHRKDLKRCMKVLPLLDHLAQELSSEDRERIKRRQDTQGDIAAGDEFIDTFLKCEVERKFASLRDALNNTGQQRALRVLLEDEPLKETEFEWVMSKTVPALIENICLDISHKNLLKELKKNGCINEQDFQELICKLEQVGKDTALSELFDKVAKLRVDWRELLVLALLRSENGYAASLIYSEFKEGMEIENIRKVIKDHEDQCSLSNEGKSLEKDELKGASNDIGDTELHDVRSHQLEVAGDAPDNVLTENRCDSGVEDIDDVDNGNTNTKPLYDQEGITASNNLNEMAKPSDVDNNRALSDQPVNVEVEKEGESSYSEEKQDTEETKENAQKEYQLRPYQLKLAEPGFEGKNTIICAPTGCGKTVIAAAIMKAHLEKNPGKNKVAFLACEVALANQQCKLFEEFLQEFKSTCLSGGEGGNDDVVPIKLLLKDYDVIVCTAQILVNAMNPPPNPGDADHEVDIVTMEDFSLIVLDECHHTNRDHPYNKLMGNYIEMKVTDKYNLPQVLGLTASLGVGKANTMKKAIEHVLLMCANMDAEVLSNPDQDMLEEIQKNANKPEMTTTACKPRNPDRFLDIVSEIMKRIEAKLTSLFSKHDKAPAEKGSETYVQWISKAGKAVISWDEPDPLTRQRALKFIDYLKTYNRGLQINHECRTHDALEYLKKEFRKLEFVRIRKEGSEDFFDGFDDSDDDVEKPKVPKDKDQIWLEDDFKENLKRLEEVSKNPSNKNPMLVKLKEMILGKFAENENGRGIVFVQTREMTRAMFRWMSDTEELKKYAPQTLVGANTKEPGPASMTQKEQLNVLDYFKDGMHKILIATSVAEEGLDIQKCNWVIRYNLVTNEIAMVQSRGRARAEKSTYDVLTGGNLGQKKAKKEQMNKLREQMMGMAIEHVQKMPSDRYEENIRDKQEEILTERELKAISCRMKKELSNKSSKYVVQCKCEERLCSPEDLRLLARSHHAVISPEFSQLYRILDAPQPKLVDDVEFTGKILCKKCNQDWGVLALYKSVRFPLLKIRNLVVVNTYTERGVEKRGRSTYKQWKDVPFTVEHISHGELKEAMQ